MPKYIVPLYCKKMYRTMPYMSIIKTHTKLNRRYIYVRIQRIKTHTTFNRIFYK
ncbi:protein of unknown function [Tepidibacter aestuarii]|nr:protein of unknown function [Tepidibacter aestuarii]